MNSIDTTRSTTCPIALWKQLTTKANAMFDEGSLHAALEGYECARSIVLTHFDAWTVPDDAVAAVVVSFLNLSETQARLGLIGLATQALCTVHGSLLKTAADESLAASLREAAQHHLRETFAALARFQDRYGPSPQVARWLHAGCGCAACSTGGLTLPPVPAHAVMPAPTLAQ